ncbi:unnamed protein product, partial [Rotaria sordida]
MEPLPSYGNTESSSNTNVSTSVSLSIVDQYGNKVAIEANHSHPIEIIIPCDPNLIIPTMVLQNVTNSTLHQQLFNLHYRTQSHQSLVFDLRELNSTESVNYCSNSQLINPPITNKRFNFTSNYELRIYISGCYYLNKNNQWKSDGLRVGPLTNHNETQCFSTHLTTFAGGFLVLPEPVNWQYVFAHTNLMKNKTVYLTFICVALIYFILMMYDRYKDRKDDKNIERVLPVANEM